jgi:hypothetical protein
MVKNLNLQHFLFIIQKIYPLLPPISKAYAGPTVCLIKVKICTMHDFGVQRIPNQDRQLSPQHSPDIALRCLVQVHLGLFSTPPSLMNHLVQQEHVQIVQILISSSCYVPGAQLLTTT